MDVFGALFQYDGGTDRCADTRSGEPHRRRHRCRVRALQSRPELDARDESTLAGRRSTQCARLWHVRDDIVVSVSAKLYRLSARRLVRSVAVHQAVHRGGEEIPLNGLQYRL